MLIVVTGLAGSGKSTYVAQHKITDDVVIDFDAMAQSLGSNHDHDHRRYVRDITAAAWQAVVDRVLRSHRGHRVWVIDAIPSPVRWFQYRQAGAQVISLRISEEERLKRVSER